MGGQDIFGFGYPGGSTVTYTHAFSATEPGGQFHYVTARHQTNLSAAFRTPITIPNLTAPAEVKALAQAVTQPFVLVKSYGLGRAVQTQRFYRVRIPVN